MKKFKIVVTKVFSDEYVIEAEDHDHALEIASEACEMLEANYKTEVDSELKACEISEDADVTYTPYQEYLK